MITELKENEVFVFGANCGGFHGRGSAGFAFSGEIDLRWRQDLNFLTSLVEFNLKREHKPYDAEKLIGKLAVLGEVGFMQGREGKSYGIVTTEYPGIKGCVNDHWMIREIMDLLICVRSNPTLTFKCCDFGLSREFGGFSWFTPEQLIYFWKTAQGTKDMPSNIVLPTYIDYFKCPADEK